MPLPSINPTKTNSWKQLQLQFSKEKETHLRTFLQEDLRDENFKLNTSDIHFDFSKNRLSSQTLQSLLALVEEMQLNSGIKAYFGGEKINKTEDRAVLHTALRDDSKEPLFVGESDIREDIKGTLSKIDTFSKKVISGEWKGYTGKPIQNIVNIGIGGSDLGPNMVVEALAYYKNHLDTYFVSNVDGDHTQEIIKKLDPETTLFVIVSKTFTTQETLTNATTIKEWFLQNASLKDIEKHFIAVSVNEEAIQNFGINPNNIFPMWDWVGGRFSLWSAVGLSISLSVGFTNFKKLLDGARTMDMHFKTAPFSKNAPVIAGLLTVWYNNFFNIETEVILPYSEYLSKFSSYLQQAIMESNGKSVDRSGATIDYQTGTIIWGSTGTNAQHAFIQLLHQGTKLIPADFIGFKESLYGNKEHHQKLMANFYAQTEALANGKSFKEVQAGMSTGKEHLIPFKIFEGNKPSTSILINKLTPETLGSLISFYEHKIFVQGYIWNIYSYDQFGVELGKELALANLAKN